MRWLTTTTHSPPYHSDHQDPQYPPPSPSSLTHVFQNSSWTCSSFCWIQATEVCQKFGYYSLMCIIKVNIKLIWLMFELGSSLVWRWRWMKMCWWKLWTGDSTVHSEAEAVVLWEAHTRKELIREIQNPCIQQIQPAHFDFSLLAQRNPARVELRWGGNQEILLKLGKKSHFFFTFSESNLLSWFCFTVYI